MKLQDLITWHEKQIERALETVPEAKDEFISWKRDPCYDFSSTIVEGALQFHQQAIWTLEHAQKQVAKAEAVELVIKMLKGEGI